MKRNLLLWVVLVAILIALWIALSASEAQDDHSLVVLLPLLVAFGVFGMAAYSGRRRGQSIGMVFEADSLIQRGDHGGARAVLEHLERRGHHRHSRALQQSVIDVREGEFVRALERLNRELEQPGANVERINALGLRAVLRAGLDDAPGAWADIDAIENSDLEVFHWAVAQAALAEAMLLASDAQALNAALEQNHEALSQLDGHLRILLRALTRLAAAGPDRAYRRAADLESGDDDVVRWVAGLCPPAARFARHVRRGSGGDPPVLPPASEGARERVEDVHTRIYPKTTREKLAAFGAAVALSSLAAVAFCAIVFVQGWAGTVGGPVVIVIAAMFAVRWMRGSSRGLKLARAHMARGAHEQAREAARQTVTTGRNAIVCSAASTIEATIAFELGELAEALSLIDRSLGLLARAMKGANNDITRAMVEAHRTMASQRRARILAALGEHDEAAAEVEHLGENGAAAAFSVLLTRLAQQADLDGAGRLIAAHSIDTRGGPHDELIIDIIDALSGEVSDAERRRLIDELASDSARSRWAHAVVPNLVNALAS